MSQTKWLNVFDKKQKTKSMTPNKYYVIRRKCSYWRQTMSKTLWYNIITLHQIAFILSTLTNFYWCWKTFVFDIQNQINGLITCSNLKLSTNLWSCNDRWLFNKVTNNILNRIMWWVTQCTGWLLLFNRFIRREWHRLIRDV